MTSILSYIKDFAVNDPTIIAICISVTQQVMVEVIMQLHHARMLQTILLKIDIL